MRFREPLLGGSAAMPGASLQRACRLLVAVCALHLGVTLVYYLSGRDLSRLPYLVGVPAPLQAGSSGAAAAIGQPSGEVRPRGAAPPPSPADATSQSRRGSASSPDADSLPGLASNLTSAPGSPVTALPLPACPEESPLLGKDSGGRGSEGWDSPQISPTGPPTPRCPGRVPTPSSRPACLPIADRPLIFQEIPGWIGVRGWEGSPLDWCWEPGRGGVPAGARWGSRRALWPQNQREGLGDFPALAQAPRSFGF